MMKEVQTILITATGGPSGLAAIRSLQEVQEFALVSVDADPLASGLYTRGVKSYSVPFAKDRSYVGRLLEICKKENVNVVLPCSDEEMHVMSQAENKQPFLRLGIEVPISDHELVMKASDKWKMLKTVSKFGIKIPETFSPTTLREFKEVLRKMDFPVVVRPRISRGARGVTYCANKGEATTAFKVLKRTYGGVIVQEFIPGGRGSIFVVQTLWDKQHQLCAAAVMQKLLERPPTGGVALAGKTVHDDHLLNLGASIVEKLGSWIGPAGIEFKVSSSDGHPYVMEVNPRFQGVISLFTKAGINFPYLWVLVALEEEFGPQFKYEERFFIRYWDDMVIGEKDLVS
jgi:carbamoyl-phosphate synthase large subunit